MEDRILLSAGSLSARGGVAHISAELSAIKRTATLLSVSAAGGVKGGTATIQATLIANSSPVAGETIRFQLRGRSVGKATTNAQGLATLYNIKLKGLNVGSYAHGVIANFAGSSSLKSSTGRGSLTVSRFSTGLSGVAASGTYGGSAEFTATLTSNGAPLAGQIITFWYDGQQIGDATTNGSGVATLSDTNLSGVNAGVYANAVTAIFASNGSNEKASASGALTLNQALAIVSLGDLNQPYTGLPEYVTVSTSPFGLPYDVSYTDASGNPVANPTAVGTYTAYASVLDQNYVGFATGTLAIVAPRPMSPG